MSVEREEMERICRENWHDIETIDDMHKSFKQKLLAEYGTEAASRFWDDYCAVRLKIQVEKAFSGPEGKPTANDYDLIAQRLAEAAGSRKPTKAVQDKKEEFVQKKGDFSTQHTEEEKTRKALVAAMVRDAFGSPDGHTPRDDHELIARRRAERRGSSKPQKSLQDRKEKSGLSSKQKAGVLTAMGIGGLILGYKSYNPKKP